MIIDDNQIVQGRRPVKRLVVCIFVAVLGLCAICGKVLLNARAADWEHAGEVATSLAATLESEIARNIESYDLSLQAVIDNLKYIEDPQVSPQLRQALLFDRSATAKHLDAILLLDEHGMVRYDSRTPFPQPVNRAERDYFQFHKNDAGSGLHISPPIVARTTLNHIITVSRRLSNPDGSFAGVVVGSMRLSYFQQLFRNAALGINGNITLSRTDGTLLMRWPYDEAMLGRNLKGAGSELYRRLEDSRSGRFETTAVTDGVHRLVVYRQLGDLPLVIGIGQATADIYSQWQRDAVAIGLLMLLLCISSLVLALYLAREMSRRNAVESALALLARTDGLTGLSNRRCFNEAITREWRRSLREHTPLALLMYDIDYFKPYNDRFGHQAGDRLLQALGTAMKQVVSRGTDIAARFGGDEFAILLPGVPGEGAAEIANRVRMRFEEICGEQEIARAHMSVGAASIIPEADEDQNALVAAADKALYRAKELGRNRIEVMPARTAKLTIVSNSRHAAA